MTNSKEAGFSLIGIVIAVMIVGIMAAIAVPKFNSAITLANTSKVQADLTTLDAAIGLYTAECGFAPNTLSDLSGYVSDLAKLQPPQGDCRLKSGEILTLKNASYEIITGDGDALAKGEKHAACSGHTAGDFGK